MEKSTWSYPVYVVSEFQRPATCDEGGDCNPAENPAHHVLIDLGPEARQAIAAVARNLEECHGENMHREGITTKPLAWNMARHRKEEPNCDYCRSIKRVAALLDSAREV